MSDYVTFEGAVEPLIWGDKTFTILRLPSEVMQALGHPKRVEGEINDHPVNLAPSRAPEDVIADPFLWAGKTLLAEVAIAPGEVIEVRLRPADPDHVDTPDDVAAALRAAGLTDRWTTLSAGKRRGLLYQVNTAKRAATRANRIGNLVAEIGRGGDT